MSKGYESQKTHRIRITRQKGATKGAKGNIFQHDPNMVFSLLPRLALTEKRSKKEQKKQELGKPKNP